ncbi:MAG TPA: PepSY domain-containing protein [Blastocatellia bacterium]|nr:PepSY domain-containing protein [Blastocatellia bacterium]
MRDAKIFSFVILLTLTLACAAVNVSEPRSVQNKSEDNPAYPLVIKASPARQQAAEEAWSNFLSEHRINYVKPDLEPVLYTPRSLPLSIANQLSIKPAGANLNDSIDEMKAKDLLRGFIERSHPILVGDQRANSLSLKDLSLTAFSADNNTYRATYQQMNFPAPLANGYGELRIVISKAGRLLQLSSRLLPPTEFPALSTIDSATIPNKLMGREFTYSNLAGQPLTYKVTRREEIILKDQVVYPKLEQDKLTLYLAYPVEVGRGTTWTVYIDAVSGQEIDVKQNFVT